jgi:hypothetical protein
VPMMHCFVSLGNIVAASVVFALLDYSCLVLKAVLISHIVDKNPTGKTHIGISARVTKSNHQH